MAEQDSGGSPAPWAAIVAVLVAVSGAVLYFSPLTSSRPASPSVAEVDALGYQDAPARLWQDPFKAVADRREAIAKEQAGASTTVKFQSGSGTAQLTVAREEKEHDFHRLIHLHEQFRDHAKQFRDRGKESEKPILVLPVLVPASMYGELTEHRLRVRVAVLEAIAASGYRPANGDHIGYLEIGWLSKPYRGDAGGAKDAIARQLGEDRDHPLVLPYEWCERSDVLPMPSASGRLPTFDYSAVLVMWLSEEHFQDRPQSRLAALVDAIGFDRAAPCHPVANLRFHVVGPDDSTTLRLMVDEAQNLSNSCVAPGLRGTKTALGGVKMFVATATADDQLLLSMPPENDPKPDKVPAWLADRLKPASGCGLQVYRTTLTDRELAAALAKELERRRLDVRAKKSRIANDDVAIVTEWDTFYGRAMPYSFASALLYGDRGVLKHSKPFPGWLHTFVYLRGIDGKVPGSDSATSADVTASQKTGDKGKLPEGSALKFGAPGENPEGLNQADYIRRLADQLADLDEALRREGRQLKAVGILGTDTYDKLLILRALRDRLHGPIYFTTGLDARYVLPSEWRWTHNLVIASAYGLRLHRFFQQSIPPFRDSDQTAIFHATLDAVSPAVFGATYKAAPVPRIFEIGRTGPYDLTVDIVTPGSVWPIRTASEMLAPSAQPPPNILAPPSAKPPPSVHPIHPPRYDLEIWPEGRQWRLWIGMLLSAAALLVMPMLAGVRPAKIRPGMFITMTPVFLVWSILAVLGIVAFLVHAQQVEGEPVALFDRISCWPTEAVRLFAALLCLHLIFKSRSDSRKSNEDIESHFYLQGLTASQVGMKGLDYQPLESTKTIIRLNGWKVTGAAAGEKEVVVYAQNLWWEYLRRNGQPARMVRVLAMSVAFFLLGLCLFKLFAPPPLPIRGAMAYWMDRFAGVGLSVPLLIILTFYVFDGVYLNKCFIEFLKKPGTHYPPKAFLQFHQFGLTDSDDLKDYADIQLIARRTAVAGAAVYYPFLVFFLVVAARNPFFADWKWPLTLLLVLGMLLVSATIGALLLRVAAEEARRHAADEVESRLIQRRAQPGKEKEARALAHLHRLIKNERTGAFSVLSQYPRTAAFLLPSGSIGLWALIEYLPRAFT